MEKGLAIFTNPFGKEERHETRFLSKWAAKGLNLLLIA
jgi:hypothetical protein